MLEIQTSSEEETLTLGRVLGQAAQSGWVIGLEGDLGAGKTLLVRGIAAGLGADESQVTSPTFNLLQEYPGRICLYHSDFYRLETVHEVEEIGYREFVYGDGVAVLEWFDKFPQLWPDHHLRLTLQVVDETTRKIGIVAQGEGFDFVLEQIKKAFT